MNFAVSMNSSNLSQKLQFSVKYNNLTKEKYLKFIINMVNGLTNEEFQRFKHSTSLIITKSQDIKYFTDQIDKITKNKSKHNSTLFNVPDDIIQSFFQYLEFPVDFYNIQLVSHQFYYNNNLKMHFLAK